VLGGGTKKKNYFIKLDCVRVQKKMSGPDDEEEWDVEDEGGDEENSRINDGGTPEEHKKQLNAWRMELEKLPDPKPASPSPSPSADQPNANTRRAIMKPPKYRELFGNLAEDPLGEILSFFDTPSMWAKLQRVDKETLKEMWDRAGWQGTRNAIFTIPSRIAKDCDVFPSFRKEGREYYRQVLCEMAFVYLKGLARFIKKARLRLRFTSDRNLKPINVNNATKLLELLLVDGGFRLDYFRVKITRDRLTKNDMHTVFNSFSAMVSANKSLKTLNLRGSDLQSRLAIGGIVSIIKNNETLEELSLRHTLIRSWEGICEALAENTRLARIDLSQNFFPEGSWEYLAEALEANKTLKSLILRGSSASDVNLGLVGRALATNVSLVELDLSNCTSIVDFHSPISADGILREISTAMSQNLNWALSELHMDQTAIYFYGGIPASAEILRSNKLTHFGIPMFSEYVRGKGKTALDDLATAISETSRLISLRLNRAIFSVDAMERIGTWLGTNANLTELAMVNCTVDHGGVLAIANALRTNRKLRTLDMSEITIGDNDGKEFGDALAENRSLQALTLKIRPYVNKTLDSFARTLQTNTTLRVLYLNGDASVDKRGQVGDIYLALKKNGGRLDGLQVLSY